VNHTSPRRPFKWAMHDAIGELGMDSLDARGAQRGVGSLWQFGLELACDCSTGARLGRVSQRCVNQLDGNFGTERHVLGAPHRAHTALTKLGNEPIATD